MNQLDSDNVPYATLVENSGSRSNRRVGCWIAAGMFALIIFIGLFAGFVWLVFQAMEKGEAARAKRRVPTPTAIPASSYATVEVRSILEQTKSDLSASADVRQHPKYERVVKFIDSLKPVLGTEDNSEMQEKMDFGLHLDQIQKRSSVIENGLLARRVWIQSLKENRSGPDPFDRYEILRIVDDGPDRLRVYLDYSIGYPFTEPHCWYIVHSKNGLKLYDWHMIELGLSESAETAIGIEATEKENAGNQQYVESSRQYMEATEDLETSEPERKKKSLDALAQCENFAGPPALLPHAYLITARRWYHEAEFERAILTLDKIPDPDRTPGVHSLRGDILFANDHFEEAINSYEKYVQILGPMNHVQSRLVNCYRNLGDTKAEREALLVRTSSIRESNYDDVAQLMQLNKPSQNQELISRIDEMESREAIFTNLIRHFSNSPYNRDRLEMLHAHVKEVLPGSPAELFANQELNPSPKNRIALLEHIEAMDKEEDAETYYDWHHVFWNEHDRSRLVPIFEDTVDREKLNQRFEDLCNFNDSWRNVPDDVMQSVCEIILEKDPKSAPAIYRLASTQLGNREFELAIENLKKALENMPDTAEETDNLHEFSEGEDLRGSIRNRLLNAYYQSGERSAAMELAENDMAENLLSLKLSRGDFSDYESLLKRLDSDSKEFKLHNAMLLNHQKDHENAIKALAGLAEASKESPDTYLAYTCYHHVINICEQQGDITNAYMKIPDEEMFRQLSTVLIRRSDWPGCRKLLEMEGVRENRLLSTRFQIEVDWEQGNYEQIVEQGDAILELAQTESLFEVLSYLVRSALRLGKQDLAMKFAESAADFQDRHDLVALVALRKLDSPRTAAALEHLNASEIENFETDLDLLGTPWHSAMPPKRIPVRDLSFFGEDNYQFKINLLFDQSPKNLIPNLVDALEKTVGEKFKFDSIATDEGSSKESWVLQSDSFRIFVVEKTFDGASRAKACESDSLKEEIEASRRLRTISSHAAKPTPGQTEKQVLEAIVLHFADDHLRAAGEYSSWRTKTQIDYWKKGLGEKKEQTRRLFDSQTPENNWFYLEESTEPQEPKRYEIKDLVAALKRKFEDPGDSETKILVQLQSANQSREKISLSVDRLVRLSYGPVDLQGTVVQGSQYDPSIRKGIRASCSLEQVESFEVLPKENPTDANNTFPTGK